MEQIPRRSFLAILGGVIAAGAVPRTGHNVVLVAPDIFPTPQQVQGFEVEDGPVEIVRRWMITGVSFDHDDGVVRMSEVWCHGEPAEPRVLKIETDKVVECDIVRTTYPVNGMDGIVQLIPRPATAEMKVSRSLALDLMTRELNQFVEFVGVDLG